MTESASRARVRLRALIAILVVSWTLLSFAEHESQASRAGLDGADGLTMQPVTVPAKVSRVAVVPGTGGKEAWAIGQMAQAREDWALDQVVFLHYRSGAWTVYGPPTDQSGKLVTGLRLSSLAFSPTGTEGWAVGPFGVMVHFSGGNWTYSSACDPGGPMANGCGDLNSVSLVSENGQTAGYAVGRFRTVERAQLPTILKLGPGGWALDTAVATADDFQAVTAISPEDAWAVAKSTSRELRLFHRTAGSAWQRVSTNKRMFDFPAPSQDGRNVNLSALGWAIAATPDGQRLWVGGGIFPVNPGDPINRADMPFTLEYRCDPTTPCTSASVAGGTFTSYCPRQYNLHNDAVDVSDVCDKPMPVSPLDISSLSIVGNGGSAEVFAGGFGLFHFRAGKWWREPNAVAYLSAVSFASAREGWVANAGKTLGGGPVAVSTSNVMGHFTSSPLRSQVEAWPQYNILPLFGLDVLPDGRAIAVGTSGTAMRYTPGIGWQLIGHTGSRTFRAVKWASPGVAWAVGDQGVIARYDGDSWAIVDSGTTAAKQDLYGLDFSSPNFGYAVGKGGTVLVFENGRWRRDPSSGSTKVTLHDVTFAGGGFTAVGDKTAVLFNGGTPGAWESDSSAARIFEGREPARLFAAAGLSDGTVFVGGVGGVLSKAPGEGFKRMSPIDPGGSVLDLDVQRNGAEVRVLASISPDKDRFLTRRSTLVYYDGDTWRDLMLRSYQSAHHTTDTGGQPDPAYRVALEPSGKTGWAVGGTVPQALDEFNNYVDDPTSSVYRIDLVKDASPAQDSYDFILPPMKSGFRFAFFSDSACGAGPCSLTIGSGTRADRVAIEIRNQINKASRQPGGPRFVIFGGTMRWRGMPEEIDHFEEFLDGFDIPVYAAMGPQDLLSADTANFAEKFLPEPSEQMNNIVRPPENLSSASNKFYVETLADRPAPWGTGSLPAGFHLVPDPPGTPTAAGGKARTFYAFDYAPSGSAQARFVFLDTSDKFYSKPNTTSQNPQSNQATWLPAVLSQSLTRSPPLPVIVVENVPPFDPTDQSNQPLLSDAGAFTAAVVSGRASAVLSGYVRGNVVDYLNLAGYVRVPNFIMGSGGAPPRPEDSKRPNDGQYHAWNLIEVDPSTAINALNPTASIRVRTQPVLDSVAMHPVNGLVAAAGNTLQFEALARTMSGGGPPGDVEQNRSAYFNIPTPGRCIVSGPTGAGNFCLAQAAARPEYHYVSENPSIADFVSGGQIPRMPAVINGSLVRDDQSGFLCTFKPGKTFVKITAGTKQMRLPVTVTGGFGPCIDKPIFELSPFVPRVATFSEPPLAPDQVHRFFPRTPPLLQPLAFLLPPVPAPIAAPAPPASAAGARKEEEEYQHESEGQEDNSMKSTVLTHQRSDSSYLYMWLAGYVLIFALGAISTATVYAKRNSPYRYAIRRIE